MKAKMNTTKEVMATLIVKVLYRLAERPSRDNRHVRALMRWKKADLESQYDKALSIEYNNGKPFDS